MQKHFEFTLFSIPKAMDGHIGLIQENAFQSWKLLERCNVVLLGDDAGVAEAAAKFGFEHYPNIAKNQEGTPLVSSIFKTALDHCKSTLLTYVNADIILGPDFVAALQHARAQQTGLYVGHRWNLDITAPLEFANPQWFESLATEARNLDSWGGAYAIDFFAFERDVFGAIPDFAIGRHHWDNWLIYRARQRGFPVVDLSDDMTAIHQNHGYGQNATTSDADFRKSPEVLENKRLSGGRHYGLDLRHATHKLVKGKVIRNPASRLVNLQRTLPRFGPLFWTYNLALSAAETLVPEVVKARLRAPLVAQTTHRSDKQGSS